MEPDIERTLAARKPSEWVEHDAPDLENTILTKATDLVEPSTSTPDEGADTRVTTTAQVGQSSASLEELASLATAPISLPELREPADDSRDAASTLPSYSFRIGFAGEPVPLDTVVFLGRKPSPPRISQTEPRRLVTVDSPKGEVSSTHLELRQRGSNVVITDLRSTNGTTVVIPGSEPRRMRQGESIVVTPGTFIDVGDGNIIEILATRLRYTKGGIE